MALNYGDNYVLKIKKNNVEYLVRDSVAEEAINIIQGTASTEGSIAKAAADAQSAAEATAATALSNKVGDIGNVTVKSYVDTAIDTLEDSIDEHNEVTASALNDLNSRINTLDSDSVKSVTEGSTNGTIDVDGTDVSVHGLGSAAYTDSTAYDAAGSAAAAQTAAISAAADDATSKANAAQAAAISAAAADATSKANAAQAAAEATAAADATSKANAAQAAAEATAATDATSKVNAAKSELIGSSTDAKSADTINAAKNYAKSLVDGILGEDSASTTLATLKQVIAELNDPANANGITGTFIDTVKAGLGGLGNTEDVYYTQEEINEAQEGDDAYGKTTSDIKTPSRPITVKEYVDGAVSSASSSAANAIADLDAEVTSLDGTNVQVKVTEVDGKITAVNVTTDNTVNATGVSNAISTAIQALDATPSQSAGADGLALSLTQVDGVVTGISGSIAANTYDAHGAAADVLGTASDTASANTVYGAKAYADSLASNYDAAGAATTAAAGVVGASGDAASANTVYGAKAYADSLTATIANGVLELA